MKMKRGPLHDQPCHCPDCVQWRWSNEFELSDRFRADNYQNYQWGYEMGSMEYPPDPNHVSDNPYWNHGFRAAIKGRTRNAQIG